MKLTFFFLEWIEKLTSSDAARRVFYSVMHVSTDIPEIKLEDILLAVNGKFVTNPRTLLGMVKDTATEITLCRDGKVLTVKVSTTRVFDLENTESIIWSGAAFDTLPPAVKAVCATVPSEIYCVMMEIGSPADFYGLPHEVFVTQVNGVDVFSLQDFKDVIKTIPDNTFVNIQTKSRQLVPLSHSIKTNYHYYPTRVTVQDLKTREWRVEEL